MYNQFCSLILQASHHHHWFSNYFLFAIAPPHATTVTSRTLPSLLPRPPSQPWWYSRLLPLREKNHSPIFSYFHQNIECFLLGEKEFRAFTLRPRKKSHQRGRNHEHPCASSMSHGRKPEQTEHWQQWILKSDLN